jgi:putative flippase GtrA
MISYVEPMSVKSLKFLMTGSINTIVFYIVYVLIRFGLLSARMSENE